MNPPNSTMSDTHKAALAEGRAQGAAVRAYVEGLEANRPKRGRKRTSETVKRQLEETMSELAAASGMQKLELMQTRRNLERELEIKDTGVDMAELEAAFVGVAADYGSRKGIEYATWREFGVSAATLKAAGISRGAS